MLYIITTVNGPLTTTTQWHVGENFPIPYKNIKDVVEIQADSDELEHIQHIFRNTNVDTTSPIYSIPMPKIRVVRWFGDIAKTIAATLIIVQRRSQMSTN